MSCLLLSVLHRCVFKGIFPPRLMLLVVHHRGGTSAESPSTHMQTALHSPHKNVQYGNVHECTVYTSCIYNMSQVFLTLQWSPTAIYHMQ